LLKTLRLNWDGVARSGNMASLQKRGKTYNCIFMWNGRRQWLKLGAVSEQEAESKAA